MKYLVRGSAGPGFASPGEAARLLEEKVLPTIEALAKLEQGKKIVAGGLPVGGRGFVFIVEASSNDEVDRMLRFLPLWGELEWEVMPLQSFFGRAVLERAILSQLLNSEG
ncbi:MAG: hypothetical protein U9R74_01295 [Pseudomonadota bacterium]|nr:hypothetical protein [Pseudomonadota bacterium]